MGEGHQSAFADPGYFSAQVLSARRFRLRGIGSAGMPFRVLSGGLERCRKDYGIDRPGFPHPIVELVVGGAGELVMNGVAHALAPGSVFSYARGDAHRIACHPSRPLVKYFVVLAGSGVRSQLRACGLPPGAVARVTHPDRPRQILDDLIALALGDRADREACCAQTVQYLILVISSLLAPAGNPAARAFATYERCRMYIESRGLQRFEMREAARACHVDEAYMCRLFQRFGRERPSHYLQHLRMNHAAAQLQTGERLIKDLALELGFSDAANFTRAFRRWFGVPPAAMRGRRTVAGPGDPVAPAPRQRSGFVSRGRDGAAMPV